MPTKISWTEETWNPVTGCTKVSEGCANCYAERMAKRLAGRCGYPADPFKVTFHPGRLDQPGKWRKPKMVFVCSMGDLFHEDISDEQIDQVYAVMAATPRHTYQVLTKRPERFRQYNASIGGTMRRDWVASRVCRLLKTTQIPSFEWPLPNVWHGTSAENQRCFDERVPLLLQTPSAVRFVSLEPLLGPVDIGMSIATCDCCERWPSRWVRLRRPIGPDLPAMMIKKDMIADAGIYRAESSSHGALCVHIPGGLLGIKLGEFDCLPKLDWVIVGAESKGHAPGRECKLEWVRDIRNQCQVAGVPLLIKQLHVDGKLVKDVNEFPEDLRIRQWPEGVE